MKRIPLTQGKYALVDDEDYEELNKLKWYAHKERSGIYYAYRNKTKENKHTRMHNMIVGPPKGMEVDHRNGDGLDNRRSNLRACTHAENLRNQKKRPGSSKYKGVKWDKKNKKWIASLMLDYKSIWLGRHNSEIKAAIAYDNAAIVHFGEFASLNLNVIF